MEKVVRFKSDGGEICDREDYAVREDLRELRSKIENTWLPDVEVKNEEQFKLLANIYDFFKEFVEEMEDYKRQFNKYQENYVYHEHYEDYSCKLE